MVPKGIFDKKYYGGEVDSVDEAGYHRRESYRGYHIKQVLEYFSGFRAAWKLGCLDAVADKLVMKYQVEHPGKVGYSGSYYRRG